MMKVKCLYCPNDFIATGNGGASKKYCSKRCRLNYNTAKAARKSRLEAILTLGGTCNRCNTEDCDVLQFDHIIPVKAGTKRLEMRALCRLITDNKSTNIQLLCANCHTKKSRTEKGTLC